MDKLVVRWKETEILIKLEKRLKNYMGFREHHKQ